MSNTNTDSDYDSDEPCANRACWMGHCEECGGNTSGGSCLREGCYQDCCMEYEDCCCDCMKCGGVSEPYCWCNCGANKERCKKGTLLKLSYFQALWRGYKYRTSVVV